MMEMVYYSLFADRIAAIDHTSRVKAKRHCVRPGVDD